MSMVIVEGNEGQYPQAEWDSCEKGNQGFVSSIS